jgi:N-acetylated-alpha-linked acidic dipeptidase
LNFAPLDNAEAAVARSAGHYARAIKNFSRSGANPPPQSLQALNEQLLQTERRLTDPDGLPRRPWYKHLIYAPGYYTGYSAKTLPGIREAIEERRYEEADQQIIRVAKVLQDYADTVEAAASSLEKAR